jgi:hypothetical protein
LPGVVYKGNDFSYHFAGYQSAAPANLHAAAAIIAFILNNICYQAPFIPKHSYKILMQGQVNKILVYY